MPLYKFGQNDIFYNRIKAHPNCNFYIYDGSVYYNRRPRLPGAFVTSTPNVPPGSISLYELNVDRVSGSIEDNERDHSVARPDIIYPFIYKSGDNNRFRAVNLAQVDGREQLFAEVANYGDLLTGSYPMSASIEKEHMPVGHVRTAADNIAAAIRDEVILPRGDLAHPGVFAEFGYPEKTMKGSKISALRNTLDYYTYLSPHYAYSSSSMAKEPESPSIIDWNKGEQELGLLSVPSMFYGREIQKGTVNLKFYITGTLVGELRDENKNGELVQVGPSSSPYSGSTAGVVLYKEGFMLLTGSWDLTANPVAATATVRLQAIPNDNDTITLIDSDDNEFVFKFTTDNATTDGTFHADGTSINVGLAGAIITAAASNLATTVNNVSSLDITAAADTSTAEPTVTFTQGTGGRAGNTVIKIVSDNISAPTPSKFTGGVNGGYGSPHTEKYISSTPSSPRWIDFAQTIAVGTGIDIPSSSFEIDFMGTNYVPTITMLAHARKNQLNFSNNPTYIKHGQPLVAASGSTKFLENPNLEIKNTVSSSYGNFTASYARQTYISKIGIYDDNKNLIGIAKVATPVKKTEDRDFTFKLKLDI